MKTILCVLSTILFFSSCHFFSPPPLLTGLEKSSYLQLTSVTEVSNFCTELARRNSRVQNITIGQSALGLPLEALLISKPGNQHPRSQQKMTVLLIGAQHGMEPSGAEALLIVARDIAEGKLSAYLEEMNFIIIPLANPDGAKTNRRVNGNRVNLSTNFTLLSEPETQAIYNIIQSQQPHVILDVHESAVLKKKTLGKQGYLIDFEAQFEAANNPNVDKQIRALSFETLLPETIALVNKKGLRAQRYIGEITSIDQTITHGGLSLRNLRNMGGMLGAFSFLLENRLDPSTGSYPTPRNIQARVAKQYLSIVSFLTICRNYQTKILALSRKARQGWKNPFDEDPLHLSFYYAPNPQQRKITIPLKKLAPHEVVSQTFNYYPNIRSGNRLIPPVCYIVSAHHHIIKKLLARHHIGYTLVDQPTILPVISQAVSSQKKQPQKKGHSREYTTHEQTISYTLQKGDLIIPLAQPARRIIPLFLELKSMSSIFTTPEYALLVQDNGNFFIYKTYQNMIIPTTEHYPNIHKSIESSGGKSAAIP